MGSDGDNDNTGQRGQRGGTVYAVSRESQGQGRRQSRITDSSVLDGFGWDIARYGFSCCVQVFNDLGGIILVQSLKAGGLQPGSLEVQSWAGSVMPSR